MTYYPDNWLIIQINTPDEIIHKVMAGWSGTYLEGSSWRLNSGIKSFEEDERGIHFHGYSGSTYLVSPRSETFSNSMSGAIATLSKAVLNNKGFSYKILSFEKYKQFVTLQKEENMLP